MPRTTATIRGSGVASTPAVTVMSRAALAIRADASVADALHALRRGGVRHLVVVDRTGRCVGMISDRAVTAAWAVDVIGFGRQPVSTLVTGPPAVITWDASVMDAARAIQRHDTDTVAVVDSDAVPVGLITASDIVMMLAAPAVSANDAARRYRHARPLAETVQAAAVNAHVAAFESVVAGADHLDDVGERAARRLPRLPAVTDAEHQLWRPVAPKPDP